VHHARFGPALRGRSRKFIPTPRCRKPSPTPTTNDLGNYFFYAAPGKHMIEVSGAPAFDRWHDSGKRDDCCGRK